MEATATAIMDMATIQPDEAAKRIQDQSGLRATPYRWPDPKTLPPREWLLGHWLLKGEVTAIIAPGGTGKSTIANMMALCLASGQPLLGKPLPQGAKPVWVFNLEDSAEELDRQMVAACQYHRLAKKDCGDRLYLDSGLDQPLCTAHEDRDGFSLAEDLFAQLESAILLRNIATIIVDPFVSSHGVRENGNEAIDAVAKRWKRLAQATGCAVVLVHHTKKLGGRNATAEDGRGAVALRDAARIVLTLNGITQAEAQSLGLADTALRRSLIRIDMGKSNRASPDLATLVKLEGQSLDNGRDGEPPDIVGVACLWDKPDAFDGLSTEHLYQVQKLISAGEWRDSVQAKNWVGHVVAEVEGLSVEHDKPRIKTILKVLKQNGALKVASVYDKNGDMRPFVVVGNPVDPPQIGYPHLEMNGAESAESAEDDPL